LVSDGHWPVSEIGMQTPTLQHVSTAQIEPAGHSALVPPSQTCKGAHCVLPGMQNPPWSEDTQTQSAFDELHGLKVAQLAPRHSGCSMLLCAKAGVVRLLITGVTQATAPTAPILLSIVLRETPFAARSSSVTDHLPSVR